MQQKKEDSCLTKSISDSHSFIPWWSVCILRRKKDSNRKTQSEKDIICFPIHFCAKQKGGKIIWKIEMRIKAQEERRADNKNKNYGTVA